MIYLIALIVATKKFIIKFIYYFVQKGVCSIEIFM